MIRINRKLKFLSIFEFFCISFLIINASFANPLSDWNDAKAYKPEPVLFLHGFSSNSATWSSAISELSQWFSKYQIIGPYLETIDFQNPIGSVDTYPDGSDGWADMLNYRINDLMAPNKYGAYTNKINLICHSMGGLAAREYLTNGKYSSGYADKLILIGTPNLGSPLTNAGKAIVSAYRIGTMWTLPLAVSLFSFRDDIDSVAKLTWIPNFNTSEALEDMTPESGFLTALNNRSQPPGVEYYGIYGIVGNFLNRFYFGDWYGGDGIVSKDSQLGINHIFFNKDPRQIKAYHTEEPHLSTLGDNPLLKFLDSAKPEFKITSPNSNGTTELSGSSVRIQGKVYKEYLPADSKLHLRVVRESDRVVVLDEDRLDSIKPSDLWIPNDPDSPVAEFDELITFSSKDTYKISCYIKNPAGEVSETKNVWVKVLYEGTNIIVHCHNPEGKEIGSIRRDSRYNYKYFDQAEIWSISDKDGTHRYIGISARYASEHNLAYPITPGAQTISVKWNGQELTQHIDIKKGNTIELTFIFHRESYSVGDILSSVSFPSTFSESGTLPGDYGGYTGSDSKTGFRSREGLDAIDYSWDQTISILGSRVTSHIRISATPHHNDKYFDGMRTYYHYWEVYRRAASNFVGEVIPGDAGATFFGQTDVFNHGSSMWFVQYKPIKPNENKNSARFTVVSANDYKSEFAWLENWVVNYTVDLEPAIYAIKGEIWGKGGTCAIVKGDATYNEVTKEWTYTQEEFEGENIGEAYFDQVYISNCPYDFSGDAF